jgi:hypothetical protein
MLIISFLGAFAILRKASISFVMSVCLSAWNTSASNRRTFTNFDIWISFENLSRKFMLHSTLKRITRTLHKVLCTFMIICHLILLRIRNVSDKTHILCSINFCSKCCCLWDTVDRGLYGKAWQATDDNVIRSMRFACWIINATNTHSEYIIIIVFPTATMATRTLLNVTLYVLPSLVSRYLYILAYWFTNYNCKNFKLINRNAAKVWVDLLVTLKTCGCPQVLALHLMLSDTTC